MQGDEMAARYERGDSLQTIADAAGCHRNTVRNRLLNLGVKTRDRASHFRGVPKTQEHRARISASMKKAHGEFPRTNEWKAKVSAAKRKTGMMSGRPMLYIPGRGKVKEHRYLMEQTLGRKLHPDEHVHHRNRDKTDNRIENLELISPSDHGRLHSKQRWASGEMETTREMNRARPRDANGRFM